jgi:hypothetical protein
LTFINLIPPAFINVKQYGAAPSNTAAQNDTAFAAAIAAGGASSIIVFPAGNYSISAQMSVTNANVALVSLGDYNTTIIAIDSSADPAYALSVGSGASHCLVSGITFQGRNSVSTTGGGITWAGTQGIMRDVVTQQFGGKGINLTGTLVEMFLDDVRLVQCGMNSGTPGDNLVIGGSVTDSEFHRVITAGDAAKTTTKNGITNAGNNNKFVDCHAYFCSQNGFNQVSGTLTQIIGGEWETNGNDGILLNGVGNIVIGINAFGNASDDIELDSGSGYVFVGNRLSSTGNPNISMFSVTSGVFADNSISGNATSISIASSNSNLSIHDNILAGATNGISCAGTFCDIHDNVLTAGNLIEATGANNNNIHDNVIPSGKTITIVGTATHVKNNPGYNPVGQVTAPGFPATTVAATNTTGMDVTAFVANGTSAITQVQVAGAGGSYVNTNFQIAANGWGAIRIPAGGSVKFTYGGGTPAWVWMGD